MNQPTKFIDTWETVPRAPAGTHEGGQWTGGVETATLYHGSSSKFNEFDPDLIGTGEGNGLLGDGFYLTDNKEIAEFYAHHVSKNQYIEGYRPTGIFGTDEPIYKHNADQLAEQNRVINKFIVSGRFLDAKNYIIDNDFRNEIEKSFIKNSGWGVAGKDVVDSTFAYLKHPGNKNKISNYRGELLYVVQHIGNGNKEIVNDIVNHIKSKGFDGVKYQSDQSYEGVHGNNYVIYNKNIIGKIKHIQNLSKANRLLNALKNFIEQVPRKQKGEPDGGQWTSEWITSGPHFEKRKKEMRVPPGWIDTKINKDAEADLQATGIDAKGRKQYIYSQNATMRQSALKFARNQELIDKAYGIELENQKNLNSKDELIRESAAVTALIMSTGIRPGSSADRGGDKQAYGATTLEGRHIVEGANGSVRLKFVGKKGVDLSIPVNDPTLAAMLLKRKAQIGRKDRVFNVSDSQLRDYVAKLDGGKFHPKDFRTLKGTATAMEEIKSKGYKRSKNITQYKRTVKAVAKKVSLVLGNTPAVALKSYINPFVFLPLKP